MLERRAYRIIIRLLLFQRGPAYEPVLYGSSFTTQRPALDLRVWSCVFPRP